MKRTGFARRLSPRSLGGHMNVEESLRRFGLVPSDESLPYIRQLLAREAEAERSGGEREEDLALLCCVQLFSRGLSEDVLRIWDAKRSGMDLGSYLDVQLLCGAGLAETKRFLAAERGSAASKALEYLKGCEVAGAFAEFSPATYLEQYRQYFGVE
jgi:hypothetical protein